MIRITIHYDHPNHIAVTVHEFTVGMSPDQLHLYCQRIGPVQIDVDGEPHKFCATPGCSELIPADSASELCSGCQETFLGCSIGPCSQCNPLMRGKCHNYAEAWHVGDTFPGREVAEPTSQYQDSRMAAGHW